MDIFKVADAELHKLIKKKVIGETPDGEPFELIGYHSYETSIVSTIKIGDRYETAVCSGAWNYILMAVSYYDLKSQADIGHKKWVEKVVMKRVEENDEPIEINQRVSLGALLAIYKNTAIVAGSLNWKRAETHGCYYLSVTTGPNKGYLVYDLLAGRVTTITKKWEDIFRKRKGQLLKTVNAQEDLLATV